MNLHRRRRGAAALGAGLAGLVIAIVLISQGERGGVVLDASAATTSTAAAEQRAPAAVPPGARPLDDERPHSVPPSQEHEAAATSGSAVTAPAASEDADEGEQALPPEDAAASNDDTAQPAEAAQRPPQGSVDKQAIRDAMERMKPLIRGCYEEGLQHDPSLAGRVVIEFEISGEGGRGVVKQGSVAESEAASPFFEACVLQKVSGLDAPAPEGGGVVTVRYPFLFDPGGGFGGEPASRDNDETP